MKRTIGIVALSVMLIALTVFTPRVIKADDFDITLATNAVTGAGVTLSADISGNGGIDKIIIVNEGTTAQTVTCYENGSSSSTVTSILTLQLDGNEETLEIDFPYYNNLKFTDFVIRKSTTATVVKAFILYR